MEEARPRDHSKGGTAYAVLKELFIVSEVKGEGWLVSGRDQRVDGTEAWITLDGSRTASC